MPDREKVIRWLECCIADYGTYDCEHDCPYGKTYECLSQDREGVSLQMLCDALELLKDEGWISVKDRLPKIGAKCLVYADGKMTVAKHIANNDWITGVWFPVPTHWMPLPEPPKEEKV